ANVFVAQNVSADGGIEREAEDPVAGGVDQHCGRPINNVSGGDLFSAALQYRAAMAAFCCGGAAENRKNRSDVYIDVDIRRAVERIEHTGVFAAFGFPIERDGLL